MIHHHQYNQSHATNCATLCYPTRAQVRMTIFFNISPRFAPYNSSTHAWYLIIVGCRFQLCQTWYRQIHHSGLQKTLKNEVEYWADSHIGKWQMAYVFGLMFLEPDGVKDTFIKDLLVHGPTLEKFQEYLLKNYVDDGARYPKLIWASRTASLKHTTNACESLHSRFNYSFYRIHPDIFSFTGKLIEFRTDTYIGIQNLNIP